jgi:hypothetical protein
MAGMKPGHDDMHGLRKRGRPVMTPARRIYGK